MLVNVNVLNDGIQGRDGQAPYIGENGHWYVWDNDTEQFVDSGVWAGNGPTIVDVIANPDKSFTFFFGDGTNYTTPSLKGADGNKIVYWTDNDKSYVPEGYDEEGIWHSATMGETQLRSTNSWPYGYPEVGDFIATKGGEILICTARGQLGFFESATWKCLANLNGDLTRADEFTIDKLFVNEYASIVGFVFKELVIDGVTHFRVE